MPSPLVIAAGASPDIHFWRNGHTAACEEDEAEFYSNGAFAPPPLHCIRTHAPHINVLRLTPRTQQHLAVGGLPHVWFYDLERAGSAALCSAPSKTGGGKDSRGAGRAAGNSGRESAGVGDGGSAVDAADGGHAAPATTVSHGPPTGVHAPVHAFCGYNGHNGNVTSLGFESAQNGCNWFWSASDDGQLRIWDLRMPAAGLAAAAAATRLRRLSSTSGSASGAAPAAQASQPQSSPASVTACSPRPGELEIDERLLGLPAGMPLRARVSSGLGSGTAVVAVAVDASGKADSPLMLPLPLHGRCSSVDGTGGNCTPFAFTAHPGGAFAAAEAEEAAELHARELQDARDELERETDTPYAFGSYGAFADPLPASFSGYGYGEPDFQLAANHQAAAPQLDIMLNAAAASVSGSLEDASWEERASSIGGCGAHTGPFPTVIPYEEGVEVETTLSRSTETSATGGSVGPHEGGGINSLHASAVDGHAAAVTGNFCLPQAQAQLLNHGVHTTATGAHGQGVAAAPLPLYEHGEDSFRTRKSEGFLKTIDPTRMRVRDRFVGRGGDVEARVAASNIADPTGVGDVSQSGSAGAVEGAATEAESDVPAAPPPEPATATAAAAGLGDYAEPASGAVLDVGVPWITESTVTFSNRPQIAASTKLKMSDLRRLQSEKKGQAIRGDGGRWSESDSALGEDDGFAGDAPTKQYGQTLGGEHAAKEGSHAGWRGLGVDDVTAALGLPGLVCGDAASGAGGAGTCDEILEDARRLARRHKWRFARCRVRHGAGSANATAVARPKRRQPVCTTASRSDIAAAAEDSEGERRSQGFGTASLRSRSSTGYAKIGLTRTERRARKQRAGCVLPPRPPPHTRAHVDNVGISDVCLHPNQVELLFADACGRLQSWDLRAHRVRGCLVPSPPGAEKSGASSYGGAAHQGSVAHPPRGRASRFDDGIPIASCDVSHPSGEYLACADHSGSLYIWGTGTGTDGRATASQDAAPVGDSRISQSDEPTGSGDAEVGTGTAGGHSDSLPRTSSVLRLSGSSSVLTPYSTDSHSRRPVQPSGIQLAGDRHQQNEMGALDVGSLSNLQPHAEDHSFLSSSDSSRKSDESGPVDREAEPATTPVRPTLTGSNSVPASLAVGAMASSRLREGQHRREPPSDADSGSHLLETSTPVPAATPACGSAAAAIVVGSMRGLTPTRSPRSGDLAAAASRGVCNRSDGDKYTRGRNTVDSRTERFGYSKSRTPDDENLCYNPYQVVAAANHSSYEYLTKVRFAHRKETVAAGAQSSNGVPSQGDVPEVECAGEDGGASSDDFALRNSAAVNEPGLFLATVGSNGAATIFKHCAKLPSPCHRPPDEGDDPSSSSATAVGGCWAVPGRSRAYRMRGHEGDAEDRDEQDPAGSGGFLHLHTLWGHDGWAWDCVWGAEARFLYTCGSDGTVRKWRVVDGEEVACFGLGDGYGNFGGSWGAHGAGCLSTFGGALVPPLGHANSTLGARGLTTLAVVEEY